MMYITISVTLVYLYTYILIYFLLPTIRTSKLSMTYAVLYIILISNTYVVLYVILPTIRTSKFLCSQLPDVIHVFIVRSSAAGFRG